jgi:hypothetical protein
MAGLGASIGPMLGIGLYSLLGYSRTFYFIGCLNILLASILFALFPKQKPLEN